MAPVQWGRTDGFPNGDDPLSIAKRREMVLEHFRFPNLSDKTFDFMRMGADWGQEGAIGDIHAGGLFDMSLGGPGYSLQLGQNTYAPVTTYIAQSLRRHLGKSDFPAFSSLWSAIQSDNYLEHGTFFQGADRLSGRLEPEYEFKDGVWRRKR